MPVNPLRLRASTVKSLAAAALATAGFLAAAAPAVAQYYPYPPQREYYGPRGYDGPREYGPRGYDRRPQRGWEDDRYYRPRPRPVPIGNLCVTSRGNCRTAPGPHQSPCQCFIPGFGPKRGAILARPVY